MREKRSGAERRHGERRSSSKATPAPGDASTRAPHFGEWVLLMHPLLLEQLSRLTAAAEAERRKAAKNPKPAKGGARAKRGVGDHGPNAKLLGHLLDLIFTKIPQNPADPSFRLGNSLGPELKNWFRAKTGNGRYRLFFRYDSRAKVIVYAWVNDETSLRTYGSSTDAYAVFRDMVITDGNPPNDWAALMAAAKTDTAVAQTSELAATHAHDHRVLE